MKVFQHHIKVKAITQLEPGNIIISKGFWNDEILQRSVIIVLEHSEQGSIGIILNKESNLQVNEALPGMPVNNRLLYGGPVNTKMIAFIHQQKYLSRAMRITNEIYWGGNIYQLHSLLSRNEITENEINFYAGYVQWEPGKLEQEIADNQWWVEEIAISEILETQSYNLWASKLMERDNMYGALYEVPDPCLN